MTRFRSWVDDWRPPEDPINHEAFLYRRRQRGMTLAAERSIVTATSLRQGANLYFAQREVRETRDAQMREHDPVLRAQLYLQRRGYIVVRADVLKPGLKGWAVGGRPLSLNDDDLILLASERGMEKVA